MKKVTAFIGSAQRNATYKTIQAFEKSLKQFEEIDFEYVFLSDYNLEFCMGCKLCFNKGEDLCPLKDKKNILLEKLESSDGIILATPNYAFQVSALMKNFLDRFAYILHRPQFFGKTFTAIVTQGIFGGNKIRKYLESIGGILGFNVVKGCTVQTLEPMTEQRQAKLEKVTHQAAERFYNGLLKRSNRIPSLLKLIAFRISRTQIKSLDESYYDYCYYRDKGWFESDYYYEISLNPFKKCIGCFFDFVGHQLAK